MALSEFALLHATHDQFSRIIHGYISLFVVTESCCEKLEWRSTFAASIFTVSDMGRKLLEQRDKQGLWLYTYL
mgnify:FL=1